MCSVYCTQISPLAVSKSSNLLKEIAIELIQNTSSSPVYDYTYSHSAPGLPTTSFGGLLARSLIASQLAK